MPFVAKFAPPCDADPAAEHSAFDEAARGGDTLFTAPPSYLLTEGLSAALQRHGRRVAWVRLGPEDRDPGTLLLSLIEAARPLQSDFGRQTVEVMRRQPGPIAGWPRVVSRLAEEFQELLATPSALVLQHVHHLRQARSTLDLLGCHLLPTLAGRGVCILTSSHDLPSASLPAWTVRRSARHLRLASRVAHQALRRTAPELPGERRRQVARFCQGRAALLAAVCAALALLDPAVVEQAMGRAANAQDLLTALASAWLTTVDVDARQALAVALHLGYSHPGLTLATLGVADLPSGPWLQRLEDGWLRVRTMWKAPLRSVLGPKGLPCHDVIHRAADFLLQLGAVEQAIPLYLQLKDADCGARSIADEASNLMDLGQWETMSQWLDRLPERVLRATPWLIYHQAEIAAGQARVQTAQRRFSIATSLFTARNEPGGACQSRLAESALASSQMDLTRAQAHALAASALADAAGLLHYQVWAAWQLGSLTLAAGKSDDAVAHFGRAVEVATRMGDPAMLDLLLEAERLIRNLQEVHHRREEHQNAYLDLEAAEHRAAGRVLAHITTAYDRTTALIDSYGWSHTPLALKLPTIQPESPAPAAREGRSWRPIARWAVRGWRAAAFRTSPATDGGPWAPLPAPTVVPRPLGDVHVNTEPVDVAPARVAAPLGRREPPRAPAEEPGVGRAPSLTAHLLGRFQVTLNDVPIDHWPSARGRTLFKYLLTHRDPWPSREALMEVFWSGLAPESARNNLNVAVHGLRRALRTAGDIPVVILERDAYRLHPDLRLWIDMDEFDRHAQTGRQMEVAGELTGALVEYELAVSLYQGDFLADDSHEEWPVLTRERLRLAYLDTVDRLSHLYFSQGRYAPCVALCHRIVDSDPCREDAHRRLMRCYSRQGQVHLALRQYRMCTEALRVELEIDPAPETAALYERISCREPV
jgi:DNA-binding SARP family transcriptional activator